MALDCVQNHSVFLMDRGGKRRIAELQSLQQVDWHRIRDEISESSVKITGAHCYAQADVLNGIEPGRHEVAIFRGDERVWEGPVSRMAYTRTGIDLHSRDVMHYAQRTVMHAGYSSAFPVVETAVARAGRILRGELARKEALVPSYNLVSHIVEHHFPNEAGTSSVTKPYTYNIYEHLDKMAEDRGIDYTVLGRAIHLWDTSRPLGTTPMVTDADFLGELVATIYGMELATSTVVANEVGGYAVAGGIDPYYGEVELISRPYAEEDATTTPTQAEMQSQAERNLAGRNPTPIQVRIPDNSSLNPKGVLQMSDLVPGVHIPMLIDMMGRKLSQMQKLDKVTVKETSKGEEIKVTLYPAGTADPVEEED